MSFKLLLMGPILCLFQVPSIHPLPEMLSWAVQLENAPPQTECTPSMADISWGGRVAGWQDGQDCHYCQVGQVGQDCYDCQDSNDDHHLALFGEVSVVFSDQVPDKSLASKLLTLNYI